MSQGVEWNREEVIRTLEPFFKMGCNIKKACDYAGIPYTTVHTWITNDETLRIKVTAWQNEPNLLARSVWIARMTDEKEGYDAAKEWIRRKEKDEFSDRTEHTGTDGQPINIQISEAIAKKNGLSSNDTDTSPE